MFLFLVGKNPGVGLLWHMISMQEPVINFVKNGPVVVLSGQDIFYLYQKYITDILGVFFFGVVLEKQSIVDRSTNALVLCHQHKHRISFVC